MQLEIVEYKKQVPVTMRGVEELMELCELSWIDIGLAIEGPQMAALNGRLPDSALSPIDGGRLEREAAQSWNAMRDYIGKKHNVWIRPLGPNSSYRLYSTQVYFYYLYQHGGNVAAYPGSSNHGWGRAVDVATQAMAYYIQKYGYLFGWNHAEGARVGEWWHMGYVGGYHPATAPKPKPKPNPYAGMTKREERLVREYLQLRSVKNASANQIARRKDVWHWLTDQRGRIYHEANVKGGGGWAKANRRKRYAILKKVTK